MPINKYSEALLHCPKTSLFLFRLCWSGLCLNRSEHKLLKLKRELGQLSTSSVGVWERRGDWGSQFNHTFIHSGRRQSTDNLVSSAGQTGPYWPVCCIVSHPKKKLFRLIHTKNINSSCLLFTPPLTFKIAKIPIAAHFPPPWKPRRYGWRTTLPSFCLELKNSPLQSHEKLGENIHMSTLTMPRLPG